MVKYKEQVTPYVDQLGSTKECLRALYMAERMLIDSGVVKRIAEIRDEALGGAKLSISLKVVGGDEKSVAKMVEKKSRYVGELALQDESVETVVDPADSTKIDLILTASTEGQLDEYVEIDLKNVKQPVVLIRATPADLQMNLVRPGELPILRDFYYDSWETEHGSKNFNEMMDVIANALSAPSSGPASNNV